MKRSITVLFATLAFMLTAAAAPATPAAGAVPATDRATDRAADHATDRPRDRAPVGVECDRDRTLNRPSDCRAHDRPRDLNCVRDGDLVDRPAECRVHDAFDRPFWRRCYNWVIHHTDIRPVDDLRFWWRLCHRWWWNQHHAV